MAKRKHEIPTQVVGIDCALRPSDAGESGAMDCSLSLFAATYLSIGTTGRRAPQRVSGTDGAELWEWIASVGERDRPLWIVGHKISTVLLATGFFAEMDAERITLYPRSVEERARLRGDPLFVLEDPPVILLCHDRNGRKLVIVDLVNYLRCTADEVASLIDRVAGDRPVTASLDADCAQAVARRAETWALVLASLVGWVRDVGRVTFGYSAASQAFLCFRTRFSHYPIIREREDWVKALEVESYHTGRTEIWSNPPPEQIVDHIDVCSFYPSIMLISDFPRAVRECERGWGIRPMLIAPYAHEMIARVRLSPSRHEYPVRRSGRTRYTRDAAETVLAGPELVRAIREGAVLEVGDWVRYRIAPIFREWCEWILGQRQRHKLGGSKIWERWAKLLANSLYGKFAERRWTWTPCQPPPCIDRWGFHYVRNCKSHLTEEYKCIAGTCWRRGEKEYVPHAFPAISSFVTSYGRVIMDNLVDQIGRENVYYRCVDSLFVKYRGSCNDGRYRTESAATPGTARLVKRNAGFMVRAINCYEHGGSRYESGLKFGAVEVGSGIYRATEYESLLSAIGRQPSGIVRIGNVDKNLNQ